MASKKVIVEFDRQEASCAGVHLVARALMEREQSGETRATVAYWNVGQALRAAAKGATDG